MKIQVYYYYRMEDEESYDPYLDLEFICENIFPEEKVIAVKNLTNYIHFIVSFSSHENPLSKFEFKEIRPLVVKYFNLDISLRNLPNSDGKGFLIPEVDKNTYKFIEKYSKKVNLTVKRVASLVYRKIRRLENIED